MANFDNLPSFLLTIILQSLQFEDFANAFKVWMLGKSMAERAEALSRTDLCKYFMNMYHSQQFHLFMNYAYNLGVHDALYYRASWHLVEKTAYYKSSFDILHRLKMEGHGRSNFAFDFFSIVYSEGNYRII